MNFIEAVRMMDEGKICRRSCPKNEMFKISKTFFGKEMLFMDKLTDDEWSNDFDCEVDDFLADDWEVCENESNNNITEINIGDVLAENINDDVTSYYVLDQVNSGTFYCMDDVGRINLIREDEIAKKNFSKVGHNENIIDNILNLLNESVEKEMKNKIR